MKTYFPSLLQFIVPLFFGTLILGGIGIVLVVASQIRAGAVIGGIVCLAIVACFYWFALWSISKPAVQIMDTRVEVRDVFGRLHRFNDVHDYELVLNNTWIGFRQKGAQDVMIDKARFSKKTWLELVNHLRQLPFVGIV